ncbi:MAG: hypothetical protein HN790_10075, partial [Methylococcales bacterium]|nr:hypothetical protein [Methylococcales bacterium]
VGLARKIGLDLATARFESIKKHGLLLNLDADCTVSLDYFTQVQSAFASKKMPAGHCQFAHALTGELDEPIYQGIARYELYLRYYQNALAYAGSPYAMYTIGSCIVVTTKAYAQSGGMNRRQAGEDFYFLQKLRGMGEVASISAMVYPSTRYSNRVPFGTGKAIEQWVEGDKEGYLTMPFQAFEDLKQLYLAVEWVYHNPEKYPEISVVMQAFLQQQQFLSKVQGMRLNSRAFKAFKKHFQHWLNGFMCLKFIHFSEAECYPQEELLAVAEVLLQKLGQKVPERDYQSQLLAFRRWDAKLEKSATYQV